MKSINTWAQGGRIYLWRYLENTRNYPGWHLAFDREGGISLLGLLSLMKTTIENSNRTITLSPPTADVLAIPNNRRSKIESKGKLRIHWEPQNRNRWLIEEAEDEVTMILGPSVLQNFKHAIENPGKAFDTTITAEPLVWFWGQVGK